MASSAKDDFKVCALQVAAVFPDIAPDFLRQVAAHHGNDAHATMNHIMDEEEAGRPYTRKIQQTHKRKREDEPDFEAEADDTMTEIRRKYDNPRRRAVERSQRQVSIATHLISRDFPFVPVVNIGALLQDNDELLLPAYLALERIVATWHENPRKPWVMKYEEKQVPKISFRHTQELAAALARCTNNTPAEIKESLEELQAARLIRSSRDRRREMENNQKEEEKKKDTEAEERGEVSECQCCFAEFPSRRMVCCNDEHEHLFCVACARLNAESAIGLSRHELKCMSTDDCPGVFSHTQRLKFLDKKLMTALDRIECEAVLRLAALDGLEKCPACNFAAEYPPIEENKEFACLNPECGKKSCRFCRKGTHLPQTCSEAAGEDGVSARKEIEEAMSAALIRTCNKCKIPFIKEYGCNKMTCPRQGCRNTQCYACSKSCDYQHFYNVRAEPDHFKCPLYDDHDRHDKEVKNAEEVTRKAVIEKNPDIDQERLAIKMSKRVAADDKARYANGPGPRWHVDHVRQMHRAQMERIVLERYQNGARHLEGHIPQPAPPLPPMSPAQQPAVAPQPDKTNKKPRPQAPGVQAEQADLYRRELVAQAMRQGATDPMLGPYGHFWDPDDLGGGGVYEPVEDQAQLAPNIPPREARPPVKAKPGRVDQAQPNVQARGNPHPQQTLAMDHPGLFHHVDRTNDGQERQQDNPLRPPINDGQAEIRAHGDVPQPAARAALGANSTRREVCRVPHVDASKPDPHGMDAAHGRWLQEMLPFGYRTANADDQDVAAVCLNVRQRLVQLPELDGEAGVLTQPGGQSGHHGAAVGIQRLGGWRQRIQHQTRRLGRATKIPSIRTPMEVSGQAQYARANGNDARVACGHGNLLTPHPNHEETT